MHSASIPEKYQRAIQMRKGGASYSQISKTLHIPKSTLSYHFSKHDWSQTVRNNLNLHWGKESKKRLSLMNASKKALLETRHGLIRKQARAEFPDLVKNPLFLVGLSLYWGEGDKTHNGRVAVINSDPELLKMIVSFYRNVLGIEEQKLRVGMFIYADHDERELKSYWSKALRISSDQFIKTQVLISRSQHTQRKTKLGMCSVYFSSTLFSIKIREWINILAENKRE